MLTGPNTPVRVHGFGPEGAPIEGSAGVVLDGLRAGGLDGPVAGIHVTNNPGRGGRCVPLMVITVGDI